jgi:hypothetical protein
MAYGEWSIGGVTPSWIVDAEYDKTRRTLTLKCIAEHQSQTDARGEIAVFESMKVDTYSNTQLLAGGSKLQVCNGDIITVTDGVEVYPGAVVDVRYDERGLTASQLIEYDIVLAIQTESKYNQSIYVPPYYLYENIDYYLMTNNDKKWNDPKWLGYGNEIGSMTITEEFDVMKVEAVGSACHGPAYIICNGEKRDWVYTHDAQYPTNPLAQGTEKLTWILNPDEPTNVVHFLTSTHLPLYKVKDAPTRNRGCWLEWVKLVGVPKKLEEPEGGGTP